MYSFIINGLFLYWLFVSFNSAVIMSGSGDVCPLGTEWICSTKELPSGSQEYTTELIITIEITRENITLYSNNTDCQLEATEITILGQPNDTYTGSHIQVSDRQDYMDLHLIYKKVTNGRAYWAWFLELDDCPPCDFATTLEIVINALYDEGGKCEPRFIFIKNELKGCDLSTNPNLDSTTDLVNTNVIQRSTTAPVNTNKLRRATTVSADTIPVQDNTTLLAKPKSDSCGIEADDFANNPRQVAAVAGVCSFVAGGAAASAFVCLVFRFCLAVPIRVRHRQRKEQDTESNEQSSC